MDYLLPLSTRKKKIEILHIFQIQLIIFKKKKKVTTHNNRVPHDIQRHKSLSCTLINFIYQKSQQPIG